MQQHCLLWQPTLAWVRYLAISHDTPSITPCSLAAFGLAALYRLQSVPGATATSLATAAVPAFTLLLLMMTSLWPAVYVQHRQPIAAVMKIWTAFVVTLLPVQQTGTAAGSGTASSGGVQGTPGEALVHAGAGFAMQLALHALGECPTAAAVATAGGVACDDACLQAGSTSEMCRDLRSEIPMSPLCPARLPACRPADNRRLASGVAGLCSSGLSTRCGPHL